MMRKLVVRFLMLLCVLGMSINTAWGQELKAYFASLKAQTSPASTGSGDVKLTWVDIVGRPLEVPLAAGLNYAALGNNANYSGPAATAQLIGATMCAMDGVEVATEMGSQIFMTSYVYFYAESEPAAGSYLAGWTFTDPAISRIDTIMGGDVSYSNMSNEKIYVSTDPKFPCFKVLPDTTNNAVYAEEGEASSLMLAKAYEVANTPSKVNNLYAVFKKYLLSNPTATSGQMNAGVGNSTTLNLTLDVEGDVTQYKDNYGDFVFPAEQPAPASYYIAEEEEVPHFYEDSYGYWTWDLDYTKENNPEILSATKSRAYVVVTYTTKTADTGTRNAAITVRMAHADPSKASALNIPLTVEVRPTATADATLYEGKTPTETSGTLEDMITAANGTDKVVVLNRNYTTELDVDADVTIDLNGYDITNSFVVSGGTVTIAFSKFGGSATSLTVNSGKAILNGGTFGSLTIGASGTVEQNGATITGEANNSGSLTTTEGTINGGLTSNKTLVVNGGTFNGATAVTVSGGTANINRGTLTGTTLGLLVSGGTANVKKLAVITSEDDESDEDVYSAQQTGSGTLNVESGKFGKPLKGTVNFTAGFFKTNSYGVSTEGKTEMNVSAGVEYDEGYRYFLGTTESALANGVGVCRIGEVSYAKLEDAIAYANNNPSLENIVIFMTNNYTLPAGYYTLPANATIVIPMSDTQSKEVNKIAPRVVYNDERTDTPYEQPTEFRRLTFASGVNMEVFGDIEMTCSQLASNEAYTSQPTGSYGRLVMEEGSHMTLQSGSELRAWGFMTGKGETDARRGSKVQEMFQMGDWKGAMTSVRIVGMFPMIGDESDKKIFPVTQYFIQNVESPVKYHPGAILATSAAVSEGLSGMSVSMAATDIAIVGVNGVDSAIFVMDQNADADNTWVRKWYDAENDIQTYDINSGAHIGQMVLDMGELNVPLGNAVFSVPVKLNSAKFDLPLTSNFKIHLLSGTMDFQQNTCLLPGAEIEVDKEALVSVTKNPDDPDHTGALYVYDAADWGTFAYPNKYTKTVRYAPSWNGRPTKRAENVCPPDAAINVHGMFATATGFVYTSEHGANIFSSNEDAGTFVFNDDASDAGTRKVYNVKGSSSYEEKTFYPARLKHGDGTYENTNEAVADLAYCYQNDKWSTMTFDGCFTKENRGGVDIYYAKPQEYVALANGKTPNDDNTYSDAAGAGRLFILMESGCQWWEVEKKDNYYHCVHPNNDTYYEWKDDEWQEVKFTITWKNWDGTTLTTQDADEEESTEYIVTYGTMAEFLGTNPTREKDADSTYNFTGWKPALGPVTQDVTYTATFQGQERKYTITFLNEGGTLIETQFLTHKAIPVCENTPTKVGHILQWSPAIGKVVADATYTATWLEEPPTKYEIRFLDYDGTLLKSDSVAVGETPVPPVFPSNKPATAENTYTCSSWDAEVLPVTEAVTYTAVYTPTPKAFSVKFITYKGSDKEDHYIIAPAAYKYGETPVAPTKEQVLAAIARENTPNYTFNNDKYTYSFAWDPQIQTVLNAENNTYTATIDSVVNQYTVTLKSNLSGVCTFVGAGTYDYGKDDIRISVIYNKKKYAFNGWTGTSRADTTFILSALKGDSTLTANFEPKELNDKTVDENQTWDIPEDTEVKDLILTSDGSACGQLLNPENLTIRGEAIFRQQQSFAADQWYAVAVPWRVNPATGIYGASSRLASGSQIYIIEFDGTAYANVGGTDDTYQYWHFLHETGDDMVPGKLYMIYLTSGQSKLDFHKKAGAALQTRNLTVSAASGSAGASFANWNAISNPALYTADLSTGVTEYQYYNNNEDQNYTVEKKATSGLIVAKPIFVQVATPSTVYATIPSAAPAPYRRVQKAETDAKFVVEINSNNKMADRLIIETADEKEDKYVIGQDLAKFGVSSKVAQMWINRYDAKLCKNTVEFDGERADYPLNIFAPAAGEYTLHLTPYTSGSDYALYLTLNGEAIWNLSDAAYTLTLQKGNTAEYGLRISVRKAPEVVTGMDEAVVEAQGDIRKVLINNQVFIIRGDKVYTIDGQMVK